MIRSDFSSEQDGAICGFLTRPARFERRYLEPGKPVAWQSNFVVSASTIIPVKNVPPVPPPAPVFFRSGPEAWPRLFYGNNLYVASFPRLADSLPRGVKVKGRTAVDVTIKAETGIAKCEVIRGSGVAALDDRACVAALSLGFRYVDLTPGGEQDVLPLLFVWDGKRSHIRVPLPSERLAPLAQLDPLDPRERRLQRRQARPPADLAIPPQALNGVILFPTLYRNLWATIEFDAAGRVTRCQLTISTGDQDVDRALCTYIETAWRFDPGEDIFGDPVAGRWSGAISF